ncbi:MAG: aminotransferase class III-fold pyridoxal phosphate-dependent enzyme [Paracoccaceae bacterium]
MAIAISISPPASRSSTPATATRVIAAVKDQLDQFTHTCHQVVPYENYVRLAERLTAIAPIKGDKKAIFVTTGAEAVENAVKIARAATGRQAVVAFSGAFHGPHLHGHGADRQGRALQGRFWAPHAERCLPRAVPGRAAWRQRRTVARYAQLSLQGRCRPQAGRAIIVEPVQGEGGFYEAPREFFKALRAICDEHGILLIADEVQTGFARTGKMFAMDHYDVQPDLMTMAKALAGGFPLAAVVGRQVDAGCPAPGVSAAPMVVRPSIAAAHAVLDVIDEEKLCDRGQSAGFAAETASGKPARRCARNRRHLRSGAS